MAHARGSVILRHALALQVARVGRLRHIWKPIAISFLAHSQFTPASVELTGSYEHPHPELGRQIRERLQRHLLLFTREPELASESIQ